MLRSPALVAFAGSDPLDDGELRDLAALVVRLRAGAKHGGDAADPDAFEQLRLRCDAVAAERASELAAAARRDGGLLTGAVHAVLPSFATPGLSWEELKDEVRDDRWGLQGSLGLSSTLTRTHPPFRSTGRAASSSRSRPTATVLV